MTNILLRHLKEGDRILLGFSGGDDSLVLFHLLLQGPFELHLAHFDHAWREKSGEEAKELEQLAASFKVPFFTQRDQPENFSEDEAREKRYGFFERLYRENNYKALILAHHQDDQAETLLKRVFEGAHTLTGMKESTIFRDMQILRPLLAIPKKELGACGLKGLQDVTNSDPRYLRARMRSDIFPYLGEIFGKEVKTSLIRLGKYAEEIQDLLESATYTTLRGPLGLLVEDLPVQPALLRYALHKILKGENLTISEPLIGQIMEKIAAKKANCPLHPQIYLDRGRLFVLNGKRPKIEHQWVESEQVHLGGWKELWKGRVCLSLPQAVGYQLIDSKPVPPKIDKLWTEKKVPAFLRELAPLVSDGQSVIGEFLSGQKQGDRCKFSILIEIVSE